jgi:hypothetical protein
MQRVHHLRPIQRRINLRHRPSAPPTACICGLMADSAVQACIRSRRLHVRRKLRPNGCLQRGQYRLRATNRVRTALAPRDRDREGTPHHELFFANHTVTVKICLFEQLFRRPWVFKTTPREALYYISYSVWSRMVIPVCSCSRCSCTGA